MKIIELIGTCAAAVLIVGMGIIVVLGCLILLPPFHALKPKSQDERLRERANLVMLKAGRFGS